MHYSGTPKQFILSREELRKRPRPFFRQISCDEKPPERICTRGERRREKKDLMPIKMIDQYLTK